MGWPTPQEYNEAIQNPSSCFSDDELKSGVVALNQLGLPAPATGAMASVYRVSSNGTDWAVRCFLNHRGDQEDRYTSISEFVWKDDIDCTVPFRYLKEGLKVKGEWYPILKMEWVHGQTLDTYLRKHFRDKERMLQLMAKFQKLAFELEIAGIAHGDLQHGNVLVTEKGLRLVDYDGLFVPALLGMKSLELGHPNYQHPKRSEHHFDTMVDNFSCWLIYISLHALARDHDLFERFGGGEEWILFRRADLCEPEQSPLFAHLSEHSDDQIRAGATMLRRMLWESPEKIPELSATTEELNLLPTKASQVVPAVPSPVVAKEGDYGTKQPVRFMKGGFIDGTAYKAESKKHPLLSKVEKGIAHGTNEFFRENYFDAWMNFKCNRADKEFERGQYEIALPLYLEVYKQFNEDRGTRTILFNYGVGKALIRAAYCYGFLGQYNLAHNCFLAAYNAVSNQGFRTDLERITLQLAMSHCLNGQPDAGIALIARTKGIEININDLIVVERIQGYFQITEIFSFLSMLVDAKVRSTEILSPEDLKEIGYYYAAAKRLYYGELKDSVPVEIDRLAFGLLVNCTEYLVSQGTSVKRILQSLNQICVLICRKEGRQVVDASGRNLSDSWSIDDLFEIAGINQRRADAFISILDFLTFEQSVLSTSLTHAQLMDELEKLSPWAATLFILKSLPTHETIKVSQLVLSAVPSRHPRSYPLLLLTAGRYCNKVEYDSLIRHILHAYGIEPGSIE